MVHNKSYNMIKNMLKKWFDVTIIGGGPCGLNCYLFLYRNGIDTLLISKNFGGQILKSDKIDNIIGFYKHSGQQFITKCIEHLNNFEFKWWSIIDNVSNIIKDSTNDEFIIRLKSNRIIYSRFIIIATGSSYKALNIPNEKRLFNHGITNCAVCDGFFFKDQTVAVIGGGNSALESIIFLSKICSKIIVINKNNKFKGDQININKVLSYKNVLIYYNTKTIEFIGHNWLTSVKLLHKNDKYSIVNIWAAFINIGMIPNTTFLPKKILNQYGYIKVDHRYESDIKGLFAGGDVVEGNAAQVSISIANGTSIAMHLSNIIHT